MGTIIILTVLKYNKARCHVIQTLILQVTFMGVINLLLKYLINLNGFKSSNYCNGYVFDIFVINVNCSIKNMTQIGLNFKICIVI